INGSGTFILGPNVKAFEAEAAEYLGVKHAIGVGNGTDALVIGLRALGIGQGDEVICPAYTFYATGESIAAVNATPVFADVDERTFNLDIDSVRQRISGRTKAIMVVHLFGQPADLNELRALADEHGLALIEDSAQGWGAHYQGKKIGSFGDFATFSFFPTKNLPCFGDGGLVTTNSDETAALVRKLRFHGSVDKKTFELVGFNSRLDEIQAAILRRLVKEVDGWNDHRTQVAAWYEEAGLGELVTLPHVGDDRSHIYHLYMVRTTNRDAIVAACKEREVACAVYYDVASHLQPVFAHLGAAPGDLPVTEAMGREGLALPMFATMTREQVVEVVEAVRAGVPAAVNA
ncbi:MAG: DegT/DnrJ/EryC1/StrS family aminotransferase, partial [Thermoleophilia bacterium]|nr:DegT/DnrJ/EryC1/StrS family aminotransferase [Thermoleophilia bacterium]